jgi:hypothetical protein
MFIALIEVKAFRNAIGITKFQEIQMKGGKKPCYQKD